MVEIKRGKELGVGELLVINNGRRLEFGSKDLIEPSASNVNREAIFFLLRDENEIVVAFGKLHQMKVVFQGLEYSVYCISTLVSLDKGKGYG
ncbi:MAG: hypothetical protein WAV56_03545, partial [Microgenomates group bacterium]